MRSNVAVLTSNLVLGQKFNFFVEKANIKLLRVKHVFCIKNVHL